VISMPCVVAVLLAHPAGPSEASGSELFGRGYGLVGKSFYYYRCLMDLGHGKATPSQLYFLLGEPGAGCCLGSYDSVRYPLLGLEVLCRGNNVIGQAETIVAIRRMPPMVPPGASDAEGKDIRALQGIWESKCIEEGGKKDKSTKVLVFEGDHFIICGGGVALGFGYKLQRSEHRNTISLSLPDPDENAQLQKGTGIGEIPPHMLYSIDGDKLRIAWGKAEHLKDGFSGKNIPVMTFTRFRPKEGTK
jgi:hypothetical protein